jgi:hypothetical protein
LVTTPFGALREGYRSGQSGGSWRYLCRDIIRTMPSLAATDSSVLNSLNSNRRWKECLRLVSQCCRFSNLSATFMQRREQHSKRAFWFHIPAVQQLLAGIALSFIASAFYCRAESAEGCLLWLWFLLFSGSPGISRGSAA